MSQIEGKKQLRTAFSN